MEKEFIPYEQALALKELGFNEPCFSYYYNRELSFGARTSYGKVVEAPTFSQAFRFFREKYGYFTSPTESDDDISKKYDWLISKNLGEGKMFIQFIGYRDSYEEAELECLNKLIEIVKQ